MRNYSQCFIRFFSRTFFFQAFVFQTYFLQALLFLQGPFFLLSSVPHRSLKTQGIFARRVAANSLQLLTSVFTDARCIATKLHRAGINPSVGSEGPYDRYENRPDTDISSVLKRFKQFRAYLLATFFLQRNYHTIQLFRIIPAVPRYISFKKSLCISRNEKQKTVFAPGCLLNNLRRWVSVHWFAFTHYIFRTPLVLLF